MKMPILYEDNHLLLVEKPINIPVQKDNSGDLDVLTMLKEDIKIRYQKPGNVYLGLVHRLDRPVGGAMVFAKTSKAASRLSDMVRRQVIERKYFAVVHGIPKKKSDQLVHYLHKDNTKNIVSVVPSHHPKGKKAILDYEVLESKKGMSLLAVQLQTGRPHQIRVQLSAMGHPIFGDQKYGAQLNKVGQQIALWAHSLHLEHPIKKEPVKVYSLPPEKHPWNLWEIAEGNKE
ncbi:RluA family pseudouridine synthase [Jeotgalibaca ciconiae]|uniref:RNA pseudouridylate synthase n=1 Tax=Jeotgalibaca ciconiae TaxID=2496265 RepID=A0A3Q9BJT9_9LACT|nr:RNA pseudouridine synthase [Jeotgalibaca ciconiae]AZP04017.1 RNA pseudouridine synthase [Jeotgalibaca ciconiae]HJB24909.1 RNA pseudouridine synthase [Candidatus Jeotgalibaca pullicola]